MDMRSLLNMGLGNVFAPKDISRWKSEEEAMGNSDEDNGQLEPYLDNRPIEPEGKKLNRPSIIKWALFLLFVVYLLISYYHAPILTYLGGYLIVEHPLKKADLIVCLSGSPVERGLGAAGLYKKGMAPRIFVSREPLPDGNEVLKRKGIHYPETRGLLLMILKGLGVPRSACHTSDSIARSTIEEAMVVREYAKKRGYRSLIIVTSPIHTRRAWLCYRQVFGRDKVKIIMAPTRYSNFRTNDWWKTRRYVKAVIIEYQKLLYYYIKYF